MNGIEDIASIKEDMQFRIKWYMSSPEYYPISALPITIEYENGVQGSKMFTGEDALLELNRFIINSCDNDLCFNVDDHTKATIFMPAFASMVTLSPLDNPEVYANVTERGKVVANGMSCVYNFRTGDIGDKDIGYYMMFISQCKSKDTGFFSVGLRSLIDTLKNFCDDFYQDLTSYDGFTRLGSLRVVVNAETSNGQKFEVMSFPVLELSDADAVKLGIAVEEDEED